MSKKLKYPKIEYVETIDNLHYLSVIKFRGVKYLCVIDNITDESISAYVLDLAKTVGIDTNLMLSIITRWFYDSSTKHPLSFEFSKQKIAAKTNALLKTFNLYEVEEIIGKPFIYNIYNKQKIRSRKIQQIPKSIEIKFSTL